MDELVAHPSHLAPRNSWRPFPQIQRHPLGRLSDDLQVPDNRVLNHQGGEELIPTRLGIGERPINGVTDVQQIDPLVLQSATASAKILSRR